MTRQKPDPGEPRERVDPFAGPTIAECAALRTAIENGEPDPIRAFASRHSWAPAQMRFVELLLAEHARLGREIATLGDPAARHDQATAELEILARCQPGLDEAAALASRLVAARRERDQASAAIGTKPALEGQQAGIVAIFPELFGEVPGKFLLPYAGPTPAISDYLVKVLHATPADWRSPPRAEPPQESTRRIVSASSRR